MPLYKLLTEMPYDELMKWPSYFEKRPLGWRDDDRAFKMAQAPEGYKKGTKPWEVYPSLTPIYNAPSASETNLKSLKGSALFSRMMKARGGALIDAN